MLRTISIAPMMDITNVHFRFFMRLLTKHSTLWTEMNHENAILNTKFGYKELLKYNDIEHPIVVQFGGNSPENLAKCAKLCEEMGYDEVNLNVGCPSSRVQDGSFGACLMKEPQIVAECMAAMRKVVQIPVTIKCRIGVDDQDSYDFTYNFVKQTSTIGGVKHFIVHARKALLKGLSPLENRNIPPLDYGRVLALKKDFPELDFTINGGFKDFKSIEEILAPDNNLVGCMLGRMAYENPWALADVDRVFYGKKNLGYSRREILERWAEYGQMQMEERPEMALPNLVKPIIHLFAGEKNNAKYRQFLSDPENFKKNKRNFRDFIYACIENYEKFNAVGLDVHPPLEAPQFMV